MLAQVLISQENGRANGWLLEKKLFKIARDAMVAAQARQAFYADRGRKSLELQVSDQVMVHHRVVSSLSHLEPRNHPYDKLRPRWSGPFKVTERITTNASRLDLPRQLKCHPVFNITALKKFHQNQFEGRHTTATTAGNRSRWIWTLYRGEDFGS